MPNRYVRHADVYLAEEFCKGVWLLEKIENNLVFSAQGPRNNLVFCAQEPENKLELLKLIKTRLFPVFSHKKVGNDVLSRLENALTIVIRLQ
jgi:hypothetical protein